MFLFLIQMLASFQEETKDYALCSKPKGNNANAE